MNKTDTNLCMMGRLLAGRRNTTGVKCHCKGLGLGDWNDGAAIC